MALFYQTLNPTPFGFFDSENVFQSEADALVPFVKRKLGDDILSVELTKKQIWACFEEATLTYGSMINEYQTTSQLSNLMGNSTGSNIQGKYAHETMDFILRLAEPYAQDAGIGGSYNTLSGSIQLEQNIQDYDMYQSLKDGSGNLIFSSSLNNDGGGKMKILEVYHFSPQASYRFFDTTSAINYLNNEFAFESFTPETVFYVLPVFEDVLRGGQMDISNRVRRSNYSYRTQGTKIRIFPTPTADSPKKLWIRVGFGSDPFNPAYNDKTIEGISTPANVPYDNIKYNTVNSMGRQWIRQYSLALCTELLGLVRSKFSSVPIPGGDLQLDGSTLVTQGREDQDNLRTSMSEFLAGLTYDKMIEGEAAKAENLQTVLKAIPVPMGKCIVIG
tara:strand:+ start:473 stop:1639 length:1167 start_codon:yes stop_codon:yes gene_type:complete